MLLLHLSGALHGERMRPPRTVHPPSRLSPPVHSVRFSPIEAETRAAARPHIIAPQGGACPEGTPSQPQALPGHLLRISSEQLQRAAQGLGLEVEVEADAEESVQVCSCSSMICAAAVLRWYHGI